jgi:hypothetical protein
LTQKKSERGKKEGRWSNGTVSWISSLLRLLNWVVYPRFNVSLIFGAAAADEEGVPDGSIMPPSSSIANIGGLVANGDGTAAGNPNELPPAGGPRLNPKLVNPGAVGAVGLVAGADGVRGGGTVPLLNSAQRGHLRFVSIEAHVLV